MVHQAVQIIRSEHTALAAMLRSIPMLLAEHRRTKTLPDFAALRAMLFYVDEFPEKRHHHKESELLFPKIRAKASPEQRELLDKLDQDHHRGELRIRELEHALLAFEVMGESRRATFEQAVDHYVAFYLAHMGLEEREVLPLAERVLSERDWQELDEAFGANRDQLAGAEPEAEYVALFSRIVRLVPAPIGLGQAART